jgi:hypothetical protein
MMASAARAAGATSGSSEAALGHAAFEEGAELEFKAGKGRIDELSARHHDDIEGRTWLVVTKQLSNATLGAVPHDGAPDLARGRDTQPRYRTLASSQEHHHVAAADLEAFRVDPFELRAAPNVLSRTESLAQCLPRSEL